MRNLLLESLAEQFEDIMAEKSITTKVLAWTPQKDLTGRPIYVRLDPEIKKAIVKRIETKLGGFII